MKDQLSYEVIVTDKFGKVLSREKRPAHSWLKAYNQLLCGTFALVAQNVKDITGTLRAQDTTYSCLGTEAAIATANHGIVVGTDDTPVTMNDYKLGSILNHGTGAGTFWHLASLSSSPTVASGISSFTVTRQLINLSGGSIIVKEIGVYGFINSSGNYNGCLVRDVLVSPQTIPDGGAITVIYTFRTVA